MTTEEIKQQTHALFLGLLYSTPVLRQGTAIVVPTGSKTIEIKEPTDAILILLEMLSNTPDGFCFQGQLEDLVRRWFGVKTSSSYDKSLAMLDDAKCISKERNPSNKRQNKIRLTAKGKRVCAIVKADRTKALDPLVVAVKTLSPTVRENLSAALVLLLEAAQRQIQDGVVHRASKKKGQK